MRRISTALLVVCALAAPRFAHADAKSDAEAKKLWTEGTNSYNLGDFTDAIVKYKAAYKLKADPVFLYNIAQSYRLSSDFNQALFFYKSYLRNFPAAPNKTEVEGRIQEMDDQLAKQHKMATSPPNDIVTPTGDSGSKDTGDSGDKTDKGAKIPSPTDAADASDTGTETKTAPGPEIVDHPAGSRPIYKKWWFWAGIGAVAVGTVAIVAASSGGKGAPSAEFGSSKVF
jgi:hypothetical protein